MSAAHDIAGTPEELTTEGREWLNRDHFAHAFLYASIRRDQEFELRAMGANAAFRYLCGLPAKCQPNPGIIQRIARRIWQWWESICEDDTPARNHRPSIFTPPPAE